MGSLATVLIITLVVAAVRSGSSSDSAAPAVPTGPGEIFREPATKAGPGPFTKSIAKNVPAVGSRPSAPSSSGSTTVASGSTAAAETTTAPSSPTTSGPPNEPTLVSTYSGGTPGLYGGTLNNSSCDRQQMISFLSQNPAKAKAWALAEGIDVSQVGDYIAKLTPVSLLADTRVTNNGYRNGLPVPRQAVLQAGTAVLVDQLGVPRARCYCGNPLVAPIAQQTTTYTGPSWPGFDRGNIQAVAPAPAPVAAFTLRDPATGAGVLRPVSTAGAADHPAPPPPPLPAASASTPTEPPTTTTILPSTTSAAISTTAVATTSATTATPTTTALPAPPQGKGFPVTRGQAFPSDVTPAGAVGSSSTTPGYDASLATDLDPTTSWFSAGAKAGPVTRYTWSAGGPLNVDAVAIGGNGQNSNPAFRTTFSFKNVKVEAFLAGRLVSTASYVLNSNPTRNLVASVKQVVDVIVLSFTNPDSPDCGGISEFLALGPGWQSDAANANLDPFIKQLLGVA